MPAARFPPPPTTSTIPSGASRTRDHKSLPGTASPAGEGTRIAVSSTVRCIPGLTLRTEPAYQEACIHLGQDPVTEAQAQLAR